MDFYEAIEEYLDGRFDDTRDVIISALRWQISKNLNYQYDRLWKHGSDISHTIIAKYCGVTPDTEKKWFNGDRIPGLDDLIALTQIFGCTIYELTNNRSDPWRYIGRPLNSSTGQPYTGDASSFKALCNELTSLLLIRISKNLESQCSRMTESGVEIIRAQIADYCKVSATTVTRWFKCERLPGIDNLTILSMMFNCSLYDLIEEPEDPRRFIGHSLNSLQDMSYADQMAYYIRMYSSPSYAFPSIPLHTLTEMIYDPIVKFLVNTFFFYLERVKSNSTSPEQLSLFVRQIYCDFNFKPCPLSQSTVMSILRDHPGLSDYDSYRETVKYIHEHAEDLTKERWKNIERYYYNNGDTLLMMIWEGALPDGLDRVDG